MSINKTELVKALRCSATAGHKDCTNCRYRYFEEVNPSINMKCDVIGDLKQYWESCDCDRIANDAADFIEKYVEQDIGQNEYQE